MSLITITALYDKDLSFFPSGKQFTITVETTQLLGKKILPTVVVIPGTTSYIPESPLLVIKTLEYGNIYANLTHSQYFALVAATYASAGAPEQTLELTVPGDTPIGSTITSPLLYNSTANAIAINGIWVDVRQTTLANSGSNGVLTLGGSISPLVNGDWIAILYYKN
jgi:hypothetical protein